MAFKFRLATIERLRASHERREKLRLMLLTAKLAGLQQQITALDSEERAASGQLERQLIAGTSGAEVQLHTVMCGLRSARRNELLRQAREAEKLCQNQQVAYAQARRAHEVVKCLRERAGNLYLLTERRHAQLQLDELHLLTRSQRE